MIKEGTIDRGLLVKALKSCGDEGEKLLIHLLTHNGNPRVRSMAAYALGIECSIVPRLRIIVNTDFATSFTSPPRIILMNVDQEG